MNFVLAFLACAMDVHIHNDWHISGQKLNQPLPKLGKHTFSPCLVP